MILAIAVFIYSCENDIAVVNSLTVDETTPIESSYDVIMNYTDSGIMVMKMTSPEVNRYPTDEEYLEMPKGMKLVFYDELGKVKSNLKSEYAINYVDKNIMEARIDVIATNKKGDKLFTELLTWDQKKKSIFTNEPVRVIQDGKTLFGDGLIADETFTDYEIINPHGEFDIESEEKEKSDSKSEPVNKKPSKTKSGEQSPSKKKSKNVEEDEFDDFDSY
ncbi:MAG: LPS export ABC transporter periplasmic protein LptC [Bacteroidales bacterium]|nr:LPS export ABC transporter periplasmic protein LptC [Bacteroidales bacterium]